MWRIGIDLGGTKIEGVALAPDGGELERVRVATPRETYDATLDAVATLVDGFAQKLGAEAIAGVGIGIPGSLSPKTGLLRNGNSTWLNGRPFHQDLQGQLAFPLFVENDANCFALSEARDGAGKGYRTVFGVILGTGVGGGIVIDGKPHLGRTAIAGEWGHNPLPWPDESERDPPLCYCGKQGCIETFLSGPALAEQYRGIGGQQATAKQIAMRAEQGETSAAHAFEVYTKRLAKALASVINIVDPDVIVFGGGVSNVPGLLSQTRRHLNPWVFSDYCETEFKINHWGDSGGVRGAAQLVFQPDF